MRAPKHSTFPLLIVLIVIAAISLPYLYAWRAGGAAYQFAGFLINPLDGITYIAKMYQGWEGNWVYKLAYSAQPGVGAYINLFYLTLGHLARVLRLPLLGVYHGTRLLGALALLGALWRFFGAIFPTSEDERLRRAAFALAALGSGLGWLALPFGAITSDFWVSEAFPFLAAYTNPHFPISLALMLVLLTPYENMRWQNLAIAVIAAILLSVISPFALVVVLIISAAVWLLQWILTRSADWRAALRLLVVGISGSPLLLYYLWVARTDPVIAAWNTQNINPAPPLWDFFIAFAPVLLYSLGGWWINAKTLKRQEVNPLLRFPHLILVWAVLGIILIYLPIGFQRRFIFGLWIPWAALAAWGLEQLAKHGKKSYRFWTRWIFGLAIPTNILVIVIAFFGVQTHEPRFYLTFDEVQALAWIEANTSPDALILASPEMGAFIPAYTGRRVIYGHPYETVNAAAEQSAVEQFFAGEIGEEFLAARGVDVIFYGSREQNLGPLSPTQSATQQFGDVFILTTLP
ncbi:MAG: hypothetical protein HN413_13775 [Chloroflexi bacterium]|nr:hypothetical protein [Chloroflexota bacterium]